MFVADDCYDDDYRWHAMHDIHSLPIHSFEQIEDGLIAILLRQELQRKRRYVYGDLVNNPRVAIKTRKEQMWEEMAMKVKGDVETILDRLDLNYELSESR
jgi:hypothetical protein